MKPVIGAAWRHGGEVDVLRRIVRQHEHVELEARSIGRRIPALGLSWRVNLPLLRAVRAAKWRQRFLEGTEK